MAPPVRLTSLTDVAERAGVSVATASRVLSESDYPVAERTRRRVLDAAAELDFAPNLIARGLVAQRTHLVGMLVPDLVDTRYAAIARGVEHMARQNGFTPLVFSTGGVPEEEVDAVRRMRSMRVDAVIFGYSTVATREQQSKLTAQLSQVEAAGGVLVRLAPHPRVNPDASVSTREGLALAVDHLFGLGHTSVTLVTGPAKAGWSQVAVYALRRVLRELGKTLQDNQVVATDGTLAGARAAAKTLAGRKRTTAVITLSDRIALGLLRGCQDEGISVPGDLSIVGFDDLPQSEYAVPALTTIRLPHFDLGIAGMQVAIWLLGGGARQGRNNLPLSLVLRESTAPPRRSAASKAATRSASKPAS